MTSWCQVAVHSRAAELQLWMHKSAYLGRTLAAASVMYVGAFRVTDWYTSVQSLYSIRAATATECCSDMVSWSKT